MKKLKDLDVHVIEDNSALTIKGGDCNGTVTNSTYLKIKDWDDEGCC
jgi:hypothetical protein